MHHICLFHFIYIFLEQKGWFRSCGTVLTRWYFLCCAKEKWAVMEIQSIFYDVRNIFEYHLLAFFSFSQRLAVPFYITLDSIDDKVSLIGISLSCTRVYTSLFIHTRVVEIRNQQTTKVCLFLWNFAQNSLISNTSSLAYSSFSSVFVSFHLAHPRR